jgi:Thiamine pyrophosphate enzyme, N-terminal TPP binding domain/Enolase C-terminal domain-like
MPNTAQFMLNRLSEWGVERIYGYPGDGINGLLGAFHEVGDRIEFTQTAYEEIASFAASAHGCSAMETLVHLEYFHDHVRVEGMLLDGVLEPEEGNLRPDPSRPGLGLELKRADAEKYAV